ncbi:MAG: response regulator [Rhodocyclaceae bacterium]|nr:response regulator [Rhodocyclaceae bacterium]
MNAKARILVIEDEEIVRLSYVRALSAEHCKVEVVADGKGAIRMMRQQPFDVVLLDLHMPEMDGMNVLKSIKDQWPESEVVIITGYPAIDTAKKAVALGAYDYLAKPVGPDDVIKVANDAMTHKRWALRSEQRTECTAIQSRARM